MTTRVVLRTTGLRIVADDDGTISNLDALQGLWTEEQYLRLTNGSSRLLEYTDGSIEVLPMPTQRHQAIVRFLFLALYSLTGRLGGTVFFAPLRIQVREGKYREPDLLLLRNADDPRAQDAYWLGADLVMEVVSPDDRERDTLVKRTDYAEADIPEYWIVNPLDDTITVLTLQESAYIEHGVFRRGEQATSVLLADLAVSVDDVFNAK